jgi:hypothetical protein
MMLHYEAGRNLVRTHSAAEPSRSSFWRGQNQ